MSDGDVAHAVHAPPLMDNTIFIGTQSDCGCEITECEWEAYCNMVCARVAHELDLDVDEVTYDDSVGRPSTCWHDVDDERRVQDIIQRVWDHGEFWGQT